MNPQELTPRTKTLVLHEGRACLPQPLLRLLYLTRRVSNRPRPGLRWRRGSYFMGYPLPGPLACSPMVTFLGEVLAYMENFISTLKFRFVTTTEKSGIALGGLADTLGLQAPAPTQ